MVTKRNRSTTVISIHGFLAIFLFTARYVWLACFQIRSAPVARAIEQVVLLKDLASGMTAPGQGAFVQVANGYLLARIQVGCRQQHEPMIRIGESGRTVWLATVIAGALHRVQSRSFVVKEVARLLVHQVVELINHLVRRCIVWL